MKIAVLNQKGEKVRDLDLGTAFDVEISDKALTLYINYLRAALREPVANTKDRSEVSGGGKKPWKQKGTGRARHGSSRSPLWVGGGVTFGPSNDQNFKIRINKNLKKKVFLATVGNAIKDKRAIVLENLALAEPKTKSAVSILENVKAEGKINVIFASKDTNAHESFRNIAGVKLGMPKKLSVVEMMTSNHIVVSEEALKEIKEIFTHTDNESKRITDSKQIAGIK